VVRRRCVRQFGGLGEVARWRLGVRHEVWTDWVKSVARVRYTYTLELRDNGTYGFLLPAEFIDVSGRELFNGLATLSDALLRRRQLIRDDDADDADADAEPRWRHLTCRSMKLALVHLYTTLSRPASLAQQATAKNSSSRNFD